MMNKIAIYDTTGKKTGTIDLALDAVVEKGQGKRAYAVSIRRLLQQWRQGTVGHKTRAEVNMGSKKPWKQKGTGRARASSARSPLWRSGGITHGPQPRVHEIRISRKQRQLGLRTAFAGALAQNNFYCLDVVFDTEKPNTKGARQALTSVGVQDSKVVLFLPFHDTKAYLSFRNIPNVHVIFFDQPNAFDLSNGQSWVFFKKDANLFTDMVAKWNK